MLRKPVVYTSMLLILLALLGCRVHFGPGPTASASFATSTYTHMEASQYTNGAVWYTDIARPYGTSATEYYIDTDQEAGSVTGKGMSPVLGGVIGEDVTGKAADAAVKVFVPGSTVVEALTGD